MINISAYPSVLASVVPWAYNHCSRLFPKEPCFIACALDLTPNSKGVLSKEDLARFGLVYDRAMHAEELRQDWIFCGKMQKDVAWFDRALVIRLLPQDEEGNHLARLILGLTNKVPLAAEAREVATCFLAGDEIHSKVRKYELEKSVGGQEGHCIAEKLCFFSIPAEIRVQPGLFDEPAPNPTIDALFE